MLVSSGIRAVAPQPVLTMAPDTRSQEFKKLEDAVTSFTKETQARMEAMMQEFQQHKQETHQRQMDSLAELKTLISELSERQNHPAPKAPPQPSSANSSLGPQTPVVEPAPATSNANNTSACCFHHGPKKPRRDFPLFDGTDVTRWLYKANQFFDIEPMEPFEKVRYASYFLDDDALHWHQAYVKSLGDVTLGWDDYVDAISSRFGGNLEPLAALKELVQTGELTSYIRDFDKLWNRTELNEKQALVLDPLTI